MDTPPDPKPAEDPGPRKPAFLRPAFVSEEAWNTPFPSAKDEEPAAKNADVERALDALAAREGGRPPLPWLTIGLIAVNVLLYGAAVATGASPFSPDIPTLSRWGANVGALTAGGQWWRLFTCLFLHIGIVHLGFNMAVLWTIGGFVERLAGRTGFLVLYLVAGLFGSIASLAWNPDVVSAGASGAIFGLYGALLGFLVRESQCVPPPVRKRLIQNALFFVGFNLLFALRAKGIDLAAHLGGLAAGWACGLALALPPTPEGLARRARAQVLVLGGGLLLLVGIAVLIPKERGVTGGLAEAGRLETQALKTYNDGLEAFRAGRATGAQFADTVDHEVVPGLRQCRTRLEGLENLPGARVRALQVMVAFTAAREDAFTHLAHAFRTQDRDEAEQATKAQQTAAETFTRNLKEATRED